MVLSQNLVKYRGKIEFEPENVTKKHHLQANWKRIAMVMFEGDLTEYYSWFIKKRFNLTLNKPLRGAHISFINDALRDFTGETLEEKEILFKSIKEKWDGKEIDVVLNTGVFSDAQHYWLIVDHQYRDELHAIRAELGLGRPFAGLHMTIGYVNDKNREHSLYLNRLEKIGLIKLNNY